MALAFQFKSQCSYHFKRHLGSGGSSEVLLYSRETAGLPAQDVVIKVVKTSAETDAQELLNDGHLLNRLNHPNILTSFGFEKIDPEKIGLVLEYFPGMCLSKMVPSLAPDDRNDIATHILSVVTQALTAAHHQGIVHGDISGRNILVSNKGQIKLADFGLATLQTGNLNTQASSLKGSIDYLAPERWEGHSSNELSDIFSVGVLALEILNGKNILKDIGVKEGKAYIDLFLETKPWLKYPQWREFFDLTLTRKPETRASAARLLSSIPTPVSASPSAFASQCQETIANIFNSKLDGSFCTEMTKRTFHVKLCRVHFNSFRRVLASGLSGLTAIISVLFFSVPVPCEVSFVGNVKPLLLTLTSRPWGSIFIDNKFRGYTPVVRIPLPAGYHEIVWRGPQGAEIKRTLQAYKFKHIHYKILMEKNRSSGLRAPILIY